MTVKQTSQYAISAFGPDTLTETLGLVERRLASRPAYPMDLQGLTPAAVALPLLVADGVLSVLFTVRTSTVEHHKNEISFPGGRVDEGDRDELAAALRETWEEIGIGPSSLKVLGRMDDFESISGYRVRPFAVFLLDQKPEFAPHPGEVSEIITVPLPHLLDPKNHRVDHFMGTKGKPLNFFHWENKVIWGLTGAILRHFMELTMDFKAAG